MRHVSVLVYLHYMNHHSYAYWAETVTITAEICRLNEYTKKERPLVKEKSKKEKELQHSFKILTYCILEVHKPL